jgi:hypothetical protein
MSVEAALAIGSAEKVNLGIGVETEAVAEKLNVGIKTSFENTLGWLDDASVGQGSTLTQVSSLGLRGSKEAAESARFKDLGARYLPENSGLALVQSQTADVFALRLVHTGALVSYQMRPNPDIPKDWNIITFRIADTYTKQGTLDGKVGLHTDPAYPQAGGGGSDRSYYKPIEAYALKAQITQAEQRTLARFGQYDAGAAGRRQSGRQFGPDDLAAGVLADKLPRFEKRNLVNTYVWTAAGGQFAEEESTLDTISESTGGSYSFKGLAGLTANLELAIGGAAIEGELTALFGGHIELSATKAVEGSTSFGVQSTAAPEAAIGALDAAGDSVRTPGKVDAYRYMTFYLEPTSEAFDAFYDRVVDPAWLQEDSPEAAALVQARQSGKRPPCWRVLHRVTYVSRVLPKLEPQPDAAPTLDDALVALDLRSNYELIRVLDPFVRDRAGRYADFVSAAQDAIRAYLPELTPHLADIVAYLVLYYGVQDGPGLAPPAEDLSGLAPVPPAVHAGAPQTVALTAGATLTGQALDERVPGDALTASWSAVDGPEGVVFADAHALGTAVSFPAAGVYVLRLTVDDGVLTAHDDVTITVTAAPLPDGAQPAPAGAAPAVPEPAG